MNSILGDALCLINGGGNGFFIALFAVQFGAEEPGAACLRGNPFPLLPGRVVAEVTGMPAGQVRHPIRLFILMKPGDACFHTPSYKTIIHR